MAASVNVDEKQQQLNADCLKVWKQEFSLLIKRSPFIISGFATAVSKITGNRKRSFKRLEAFRSLVDEN